MGLAGVRVNRNPIRAPRSTSCICDWIELSPSPQRNTIRQVQGFQLGGGLDGYTLPLPGAFDTWTFSVVHVPARFFLFFLFFSPDSSAQPPTILSPPPPGEGAKKKEKGKKEEKAFPAVLAPTAGASTNRGAMRTAYAHLCLLANYNSVSTLFFFSFPPPSLSESGVSPCWAKKKKKRRGEKKQKKKNRKTEMEEKENTEKEKHRKRKTQKERKKEKSSPRIWMSRICISRLAF